ncbi:anhydro-N-acetylmuramic acid kinase [Gilvimarinus algae]|uniref:Anhydro-N-acetylmuramic acid kinase n=1 Tax=Gilvimarinus algae TaxID=3058037 RepID=A0ABT8TLC0_9GAMM|nr:anhydro-N-acetylmuramic acid kinase [Gilvimarinus sp. SDUM040014]MDO3383426.1 anhydro-N-acetylmuramic acid kinase [Gilvimarinus sp. SDUM040014]
MALYIGLISGTSADGIDAALVEISADSTRLVEACGLVFDAAFRRDIHALCSPGANEIDRAGELDQILGRRFAEAALALVTKAAVKTTDITAIGSHGQTIRHRPPGQTTHPFTWQIGDPNLIASLTGITTVADFRRRDMASGGQGAPLVPAFHQAAFASPTAARAIINIGGIANISWLTPGGAPLGFDTGPGNTLMDAWIQRHCQRSYDADGEWASTGRVHSALLAQLMAHPYLTRSLPKSTGREDFHLPWLDEQLSGFTALAAEDVQATLLEVTAASIANHLLQCPGAELGGEIYLCGGGAHNKALKTRLAQLAKGFSVATTAALGVDPDWVEAAAFAWLAARTLQGMPGNLPSATGAKAEVVLGGIYPGERFDSVNSR